MSEALTVRQRTTQTKVRKETNSGLLVCRATGKPETEHQDVADNSLSAGTHWNSRTPGKHGDGCSNPFLRVSAAACGTHKILDVERGRVREVAQWGGGC